MTAGRTIGLWVLLLVIAGTSSGCIYSREIAATRRSLERSTPELKLDRKFVMNIGPAGVRFAGLITRLLPADDVRTLSPLLRDVRRVKIGVYRVESRSSADQAAERLAERMTRSGWEVAVRVHEDEDHILFLYREHRATVRDVYMFTLSEEELVIARVRGRLDRLLGWAVEQIGAEEGLATR